jgi:uncharacterized protein
MQHAGIGLRQPHYAALLGAEAAAGAAAGLPVPAFVELHAENHFGAGGAALGVALAARERWPVSLHGVALGLGSAAGIDASHLERLAALVQAVQPQWVSDHACFARAPLQPGAVPNHAADLLPLAFTDAALDILCANVGRVQDRLKRPILVENIAAYVRWADADLSEPEFFNRLVQRSGCGVLLDLNNIVVNALNASNALNEPRDPAAAVRAACAWVDAIDPAAVGEIHLAGYHDGGDIVIDDHGSRVHAPVWQVYRHTLARLGPRPTLVEWDTTLPPLEVLLQEAQQAEALAAEA